MQKKPIGNFVMLKEYKLETEEEVGGILVPDNTTVSSKMYEVTETGTGQTDDNGDIRPFKVDIGDIVIVSEEHPKTTLNLESEKIIIVNQDEIVSKVEI